MNSATIQIIIFDTEDDQILEDFAVTVSERNSVVAAEKIMNYIKEYESIKRKLDNGSTSYPHTT